MNDTLFANSFHFNEFHRGKHAYTDMRAGSPMHFIAYMLKGHCRIVTADTQIEAEEGDFFYIPNGLCYRSYWQDSEDVTFLSLGFPYFPNAEKRSYPLQCIPTDAEARERLSRVPIGNRGSAASIAAFYTLLAHLIPFMQESMPCRTRKIVSIAEQALWENPQISIAELARRAEICESALYAAFEKASEETPRKMRERILFEKAKDLLLTTDLPIEAISEKLNFCSCAYFRKRFKACFGVSPREIRKSATSL